MNVVSSTPVTAANVQTNIPVGAAYCGFSANAGAAAVMEIRDGSATGTLLDVINAAAAGAYGSNHGAAPLACSGRIFINLVSGTLPASFSIRWR